MRKAVTHLKKSDPVLRAIIERIGPCRMEFGPAEFSSLAEAIVYQQLNGKVAVTIFKRFAALAGEPITPDGILRLSNEQLRSVGLSKQKSAYLKDLATKTASGLLDFSRLPELPDEEVIKHLTQVKGVGVWTAHMDLELIKTLLIRENPCDQWLKSYGGHCQINRMSARCLAGVEGADPRRSKGQLSESLD